MLIIYIYILNNILFLQKIKNTKNTKNIKNIKNIKNYYGVGINFHPKS